MITKTFVFKIRDVYTGNWLPIKIRISETKVPGTDQFELVIVLIDSEGMEYLPEEVVH